MQLFRSQMPRFLTVILLGMLIFSFSCTPALAASSTVPFLADYNTGNPTLNELWVDPVNGNDTHAGSEAAPLKTVDAAWGRIPQGVTLATGFRINLKPGNYPVSNLPNYWESRYGTFAAPIFIQGKGTGPGQVVFQGNVNMYDVRYIYFDNLSIIHNGDAFHCELCNHLLLRKTVLNGGQVPIRRRRGLKVNQSQYVYVENSDISYAWDNAVDFVAVQYGHIIKNKIHDWGIGASTPKVVQPTCAWRATSFTTAAQAGSPPDRGQAFSL